MRRYWWGLRKYLIALGAGAALMALSGAAAQTAMATGSGGVPAPLTGVLSKPILGMPTPHFSVLDSNPVEQVRQLAQCGGTMYAVGSFSKIDQGQGSSTVVIPRQNIFSFSATAPFTVTSWAPNVNGIVNSIAFNNGNCSDAYIGGQFTSINGTAVKNIAEIDTTTGAVVNSFAHNASAQVETLQAVNGGTDGHLLVGGYYKTINGSSAVPGTPTYDPYMTSLDPTTGKDDGFVHLNISGHYQYSGVSSNLTRVYNQALSNGGTLDLVMGDFTSVGGQPRQQIFELNVGGSSATVTGWTSSEFNGHCATTEPFYVQAASWSPDDSTIYIATTGRQPPNTTKPGGLCDAAVAFPATQTSLPPSGVSHAWINYTGCDSLFSTAADASTAYFAGHERWSMNPDNCNHQGPSAYTATGLEGLQPTTGALYVNPKNKAAAYYERSRGLGADDMLHTSAGLWIASDNLGNSQTCGNTSGLSGICFLPYGS